MSEVETLTELNRVLLYKAYNKDKFDQFTSYTENLIILENFLRKTNFFISQALGGEQQPDSKEANNLIESLKQQVKKRERKILFPDDTQIGVPAKTVKKRVSKAEEKASKAKDKTNDKSAKTSQNAAQVTNTGEQASINSFKSFAYHMQVVIQTKLLAKLESLYS